MLFADCCQLSAILMKLSIIIPAHNEQATIAGVLEKVAMINVGLWEKEIIVVDDGSKDGTADVISQFIRTNPHCIFISHGHNFGKGQAIKSALEKVTGDYVIIQDADLEYDPADIPKLLSKLDEYKGARVVIFGARGSKSYPERGFHYVLGAKLLTWAVNILFGARLTDLYTCYKLFPAGLIKGLNLQSQGFEFEAEVTCQILKKGYKIKEVPISYRPRNRSQGKHLRPRDGIIGLYTIIKNRIK